MAAQTQLRKALALAEQLDDPMLASELQLRLAAGAWCSGASVQAGAYLAKALAEKQTLGMLKEEYFDFLERDAAADPRSTRAAYSPTEQPWLARYQQISAKLGALLDVLDAGYPVVHIASHFVFSLGTERSTYLPLYFWATAGT